MATLRLPRIAELPIPPSRYHLLQRAARLNTEVCCGCVICTLINESFIMVTTSLLLDFLKFSFMLITDCMLHFMWGGDNILEHHVMSPLWRVCQTNSGNNHLSGFLRVSSSWSWPTFCPKPEDGAHWAVEREPLKHISTQYGPRGYHVSAAFTLRPLKLSPLYLYDAADWISLSGKHNNHMCLFICKALVAKFWSQISGLLWWRRRDWLMLQETWN